MQQFLCFFSFFHTNFERATCCQLAAKWQAPQGVRQVRGVGGGRQAGRQLASARFALTTMRDLCKSYAVLSISYL